MSYLEALGEPDGVINEEDYVEKVKKLSPFDFLNSINYSKENLIQTETDENQYNAFIVNRGLGFGVDTVIAANEMNSRPHLDKKMQFDFLCGVVRKAKRYNKWIKSEEEDLETIQEFFGYSFNKAKEALTILSKDEIDSIRNYLLTCKGGRL